jgi:endonuclease-3
MTRKERFDFVLHYFLKHAPNPATELHYNSPFQMLVAVILSAQCTDKRVNLTTPALFHKFPSAAAMSEASFSEIFSMIKSISYPNNKARHLMAMSKIIHDQYQGRIPRTLEELIELPGVGRKTANVVLAALEDQPRIAVDTHVFRVSARIGLTVGATTPFAAEKQLVKYFPEKHISKVSHWLILHGRYTCKARKPDCEACALRSVCKFYLKNKPVPKNGE